jgi:hypothetical protein
LNRYVIFQMAEVAIPRQMFQGICGSWRNCGHSHHQRQRQRETFDVMHSRATDRRSACKCQGKWPDQTLDQAFGLPEVLVAVTPRVCQIRANIVAATDIFVVTCSANAAGQRGAVPVSAIRRDISGIQCIAENGPP